MPLMVVAGNASGPLGYQFLWRRAADVAEAEHADHSLALVDHRQSPDLQLLHVLNSLGEIVVLPAAMNAGGHDIACCRVACIEAVAGQTAADNVAAGDHADQLVVLSDRDGADIVLLHKFCDFGDGCVRRDPVDALMHCFFDFHSGPPLLEWVHSNTALIPPALSNYT